VAGLLLLTLDEEAPSKSFLPPFSVQKGTPEGHSSRLEERLSPF